MHWSRRRFVTGLALCGASLHLFPAAGGAALREGGKGGRRAAFAGPPISRGAFKKRLTKIRRQMRQRGLSCLLVSSVMNHAVRYLGFFDPDLQGRASGSPQLAVALLPLEGNPVFLLQTFTSADYLLPRARAASLVEDIRLVRGGHEQVLEAAVAQLREWKFASGPIGLAGGEIDWAAKLFLSNALPKLQMEDADSWLGRLRVVKEPEEIELMRRSAAIGDAGIRAVQRQLRPGLSDYELYALAEAEMRRQGADEDTFILMGLGPNENPMLMEGLAERRVEPDSVVIFEVLPYYRHYNTELAVTFQVGRASTAQKKAAEACQAAYEAGVEQIRPGVPTSQVVDAARKVFRKFGFSSFTHSAGHFIGLDNYEGPPFRLPDVLLEPGMVFSFHPNVVVPEKVKEQVCGLLLVTEKGVENLSTVKPRGMHPV